MTSRTLATLGLGIVLAVLVVPFGGPYAPVWLLGITALVAFDLWRVRRSEEGRAAGVPARVRREFTAAQRLAIVIGGFVAFSAVAYAIVLATR